MNDDELAAAATDEEPAAEKIWSPTDKQQTFLRSTAFEALFGGAAGGGKSDGLLMGALRHVNQPSYRALLVRRTFPELEASLIERARFWYPKLGGSRHDNGRLWRWASGAVVQFGHVEHDTDVDNYLSTEYQYIGFDELTTFTEIIFRRLCSRLRSSSGLPVVARAGTNPGGEGHEWVLEYWAPWLRANDPKYEGPRARSGQKLYYRPNEEGSGVTWLDGPQPGALSRVFVQSFVADNPHIDTIDPQYKVRLGLLNPVDRKRLRDGDWLARPGAGAYFKRQWFNKVAAPPKAPLIKVRHWDLAATVEGYDRKGKLTDPDWTAGMLLSYRAPGMWCIEHVLRFRGRPGEVKQTILDYANRVDGHGVRISIPQDPGQAGVAQAEDYARALVGFDVHCRREMGEKVERAKPVSAQVEAKMFEIVEGSWNTEFLDEAEAFPEGKKDQIDALSGAFADILSSGYVTIDDVSHGTRRTTHALPAAQGDDASWGEDGDDDDRRNFTRRRR